MGDGYLPGDHPSPDRLLAYQERELSPEVADRVLEHLVGCDACCRVVLDFAAFPDVEPPDATQRLSLPEVEERWQSLAGLVAARGTPIWQRRQVLQPLAAGLLAAVVALGLWGAGLRREVTALEQVRGDLEVVADLVPEVFRARGGVPTIRPSDGAGRVALLLVDPLVASVAAPGEVEHPAYVVDLVAGDGGSVLTGLPVLRGRSGDFSAELPADVLAPGRYRIELYGLGSGGRGLLAAYPFEVAPEKPGA